MGDPHEGLVRWERERCQVQPHQIVQMRKTGLRPAFAGIHFGHRSLLHIHTTAQRYTLHEAHMESGAYMRIIIVIIYENKRQRTRDRNKVYTTGITRVQAPCLAKRAINKNSKKKLAKLTGKVGEKSPDSEQRSVGIKGSKSGAPENQKTGCLMLTTMWDSTRYPPKGTKGSHRSTPQRL